MKILEITFETPSYKSGGGIGIIQSIESLQICGEVDYVGPEFEKTALNISEKKVVGFLYYSDKITDRFKSLLDGVTNGYYQSWRRIEQSIDWKSYDLVSVEFTRYPFVIKAARKNNVPVIVRVHNVEKDYFHNLFCVNKRIVRKLQEIFYSVQEKKSIEMCDGLIALTSEDKRRIIELYGKKYAYKTIVNPVCIKDQVNDSSTEKNGFLITGSLWYGPNADGVLWFLKNVWNKFSKISNSILCIAGSKPNDEIKKLAKQYTNVELVDTPKDMKPYFERTKCYIAPIFSGAGMKVKIAEAMMYGIPILASEHALIGYKQNEATKMFSTADELIKSMKQINEASDIEIERLYRLQRKSFIHNYSIDSSAKNYKELISQILK